MLFFLGLLLGILVYPLVEMLLCVLGTSKKTKQTAPNVHYKPSQLQQTLVLNAVKPCYNLAWFNCLLQRYFVELSVSYSYRTKLTATILRKLNRAKKYVAIDINNIDIGSEFPVFKSVRLVSDRSVRELMKSHKNNYVDVRDMHAAKSETFHHGYDSPFDFTDALGANATFKPFSVHLRDRNALDLTAFAEQHIEDVSFTNLLFLFEFEYSGSMHLQAVATLPRNAQLTINFTLHSLRGPLLLRIPALSTPTKIEFCLLNFDEIKYSVACSFDNAYMSKTLGGFMKKFVSYALRATLMYPNFLPQMLPNVTTTSRGLSFDPSADHQTFAHSICIIMTQEFVFVRKTGSVIQKRSRYQVNRGEGRVQQFVIDIRNVMKCFDATHQETTNLCDSTGEDVKLFQTGFLNSDAEAGELTEIQNLHARSFETMECDTAETDSYHFSKHENLQTSITRPIRNVDDILQGSADCTTLTEGKGGTADVSFHQTFRDQENSNSTRSCAYDAGDLGKFKNIMPDFGQRKGHSDESEDSIIPNSRSGKLSDGRLLGNDFFSNDGSSEVLIEHRASRFPPDSLSHLGPNMRKTKYIDEALTKAFLSIFISELDIFRSVFRDFKGVKTISDSRNVASIKIEFNDTTLLFHRIFFDNSMIFQSENGSDFFAFRIVNLQQLEMFFYVNKKSPLYMDIQKAAAIHDLIATQNFSKMGKFFERRYRCMYGDIPTLGRLSFIQDPYDYINSILHEFLIFKQNRISHRRRMCVDSSSVSLRSGEGCIESEETAPSTQFDTFSHTYNDHPSVFYKKQLFLEVEPKDLLAYLTDCPNVRHMSVFGFCTTLPIKNDEFYEYSILDKNKIKPATCKSSRSTFVELYDLCIPVIISVDTIKNFLFDKCVLEVFYRESLDPINFSNFLTNLKQFENHRKYARNCILLEKKDIHDKYLVDYPLENCSICIHINSDIDEFYFSVYNKTRREYFVNKVVIAPHPKSTSSYQPNNIYTNKFAFFVAEKNILRISVIPKRKVKTCLEIRISYNKYHLQDHLLDAKIALSPGKKFSFDFNNSKNLKMYWSLEEKSTDQFLIENKRTIKIQKKGCLKIENDYVLVYKNTGKTKDFIKAYAQVGQWDI